MSRRPALRNRLFRQARAAHALDPAERLVLQELVLRGDDAGLCRITTPILSSAIGCPARTTERRLATLRELGYIARGEGQAWQVLDHPELESAFVETPPTVGGLSPPQTPPTGGGLSDSKPRQKTPPNGPGLADFRGSRTVSSHQDPKDFRILSGSDYVDPSGNVGDGDSANLGLVIQDSGIANSNSLLTTCPPGLQLTPDQAASMAEVGCTPEQAKKIARYLATLWAADTEDRKFIGQWQRQLCRSVRKAWTNKREREDILGEEDSVSTDSRAQSGGKRESFYGRGYDPKRDAADRVDPPPFVFEAIERMRREAAAPKVLTPGSKPRELTEDDLRALEDRKREQLRRLAEETARIEAEDAAKCAGGNA